MTTFPWEGAQVTFEQLADGLREKFPAPAWDIPPALVRDASNVAPFMLVKVNCHEGPRVTVPGVFAASPLASPPATAPWQLPPLPAKS